jgi:hypothetical protein
LITTELQSHYVPLSGLPKRYSLYVLKSKITEFQNGDDSNGITDLTGQKRGVAKVSG